MQTEGHWQEVPAVDGPATATRSKRHKAAARPTVTLTLQDATHEPAAQVVIAWLYSERLAVQRLQELPQQQLLATVLLADMMQAREVGSLALQQLREHISSDQGPSVELVREFLRAPALPLLGSSGL